MGMRHFDVQLIGGMVLHGGNIAEMKTGEGKTLTATLAVVLNSLPGTGVHVVTVNDYLARRDAEWMSPIYEALGVTVGVLQNMQSYEDKHVAYAADVTYGTNSEFGFDYLRDNMATAIEEKVQRGHPFGGRRRGRQHPHRRGPHAADHLGRAGAGGRALPPVRQARATRWSRASARTGLDPKSKKDFVADFDYEFDEKHKTVAVTERGVAKAERFLGVDHLYRAENGHMVNHLLQSLKAESLYKRDVDYAVIDDEVRIIDEFTGRILEGRRWSEGLHQAVEAKEGVRVQEENQTLATITLQNYFRMYDKLAGHDGHRPHRGDRVHEDLQARRRPDPDEPPDGPRRPERPGLQDQGRQVARGASSEIARAPQARPAGPRRHDLGRGLRAARRRSCAGAASRTWSSTPSPSTPSTRARSSPRRASPARSRSRRTWPAAASTSSSAATPSTSRASSSRSSACSPATRTTTSASPTCSRRSRSASRSNREQVMEAGGLFIVGTERHESRRIDNQLRGRSGRQGDPGESRFFLSAEDDLVRLFAGDRIYKILNRFGTTDEEGNEEPIEAGMLSKQIEKAQRKVEEQNFLIRKRVLEYDDVMNEQRRIVYEYRDNVLEGRDMGERRARRDRLGHPPHGRGVHARRLRGGVGPRRPVRRARRHLADEPHGRAGHDREPRPRGAHRAARRPDAVGLYDRREAELGDELMRALERFLLLQIIDNRWREHLYDMDYLREGIHLRGFAQIEPIVAYKNEAFELFSDLMNTIWSDFARMIFHVEVEVEGENGGAPEQYEPRPSITAGGSSTRAGQVTYTGGVGTSQPSALAEAAGGAGAAVGPDGYPVEAADEVVPASQQRRVEAAEQIGRNDPCWCGSGKKFKKCHGA